APASELPFLGGAVGYLGYELASQFDVHRFRSLDDLQLPDLYLLFVDRFLAHDARDDRLYACALGFAETSDLAADRARRALDALCAPIVAPARAARRARRARPPAAASAFFDAQSYAKAVDATKQQIEAGEVYQACFTQRRERDCPADSWLLYRKLRDLNPAPFASYVELPEVAIVGSSPERFLRVDDERRVESRPIKGTRPRGRDLASDRARRSELERSAKDRAENLMIVDLVRNDLGRVCEIGSVEVPELMAIERYASVYQMVSTVRGTLRRPCDAFDLVRATFPPGSMTGAPKIAAMRILDALEPVRRGIYSGALGYFDLRGGADLCVVIRTILVVDGRAYLHSGGGIVADSNAADEWQESLDKAQLLEAAIDEACANARDTDSCQTTSAFA
ncbi:MAG TPA: aminodeoxychorismate synthase component I, partial [Myxococcota bacterium]|nr:aminodeoxychorismate synthase component I [Myxococcota bacterium]